ncbi:MAG: PEGA domain-containing protein, partial [Deltaproteobacteria bacterium]
PANRPQSAAEFRQRLSDFLHRWDRRADDQALSAFLIELVSGGKGHDKKEVGFAFGEATSQWMASGEDLEKLVPLTGAHAGGRNGPADLLDPLQELKDAAPPSFSAPRGKFSGGETVMAIKESGLGKGRTVRNLLLVLLALGAIAAVAFLLLRSLGGREEKLASRKVKEAKAKLAAPLFIELSPPDAAILVDGRPVQPVGAPPRIEGLSAGEHTLKVLSPGYLPAEKKVVLGTEKNDPLRFDLRPRKGKLAVKTIPRGALVWVDGRRRGKTPLALKEIETGKEHEIVIKKLRFKPVKLKIGPADWPEDPAKPLVVEKRLKRVRRRRRR